MFPFVFALCVSCQKNETDNVVSQKYIHKYGFDLTQKEWSERDRDGRIVTVLKDHTTLAQSYENGILHGPTTLTYPKSHIIQKEDAYDQGELLKTVFNDEKGLPIKEEAYEFDNRKIITYWFENGAPMSIEEYEGDYLTDASYFDLNNELEASIEKGKGDRIRRSREGKLLSSEIIENGEIQSRKTYHPNGHTQSISHFDHYQLDGVQKKYTLSGKPLLEQTFSKGILHGMKCHFRNGKKVVEIPYINGKKNGLERHFDESGALIAEIPWEENQKHGRSRYQYEDYSDLQWYFRGNPVSKDKFGTMQVREEMLAELSLENGSY